MRWCWELWCREIQSLTVRQIVPLATCCPFNFSACWLIAKEHCLSQWESNLACLPGYSSAKAPYNEPVLSAPSSRLLWCCYLPSFSWLTIQKCTNLPTRTKKCTNLPTKMHKSTKCPPPPAWKLQQGVLGNEKKRDSTIATNENQHGIVTHFNIMQ